MTTIAYRDGVMAADSRAYRCSRFTLGEKVKVRRLGDGRLIGCSSGYIGVANAVMDWFAAGMTDGPAGLGAMLSLCGDNSRNFELLCVDPEGNGTIIDGNGLPTTARAEFYVCGSGDEIALGAMAAGKSAAEAVLIACGHDAYSAPPVYVATHDQDPKEYGPVREGQAITSRPGLAAPLQDGAVEAPARPAAKETPDVPVSALPGKGLGRRRR